MAMSLTAAIKGGKKDLIHLKGRNNAAQGCVSRVIRISGHLHTKQQIYTYANKKSLKNEVNKPFSKSLYTSIQYLVIITVLVLDTGDS